MVATRRNAIILLLIYNLLSVTGGENLNRIDNVVKFLTKFQNVHHAVFFLCDFNNAYEYSVEVPLRSGIFVNIVILSPEMEITKTLPRKSYSKCGFIIDVKCSKAEIAVRELSRYKYFNTTYPTLLLNLDDPQRLAKIAPTIGYNSNIYFIIESSSTVEMFELYSYGLHLHNTTLKAQEVVNWTERENYHPSYKLNERGNFFETQLRGVTVIDIDGILSSDVDFYLTESAKTNGVTQFVKYHYNLVKLLGERFNFKVHYHVTRGWAGRLPSGYRLGLLGVLARDEADVAGSGIFNRINRFDEFDIVHQSWIFNARFIYRVDPDAVGIDAKIFLAPFTYPVWGALVLITVTILLFNRIVYFIERHLPELVDNSPRLDSVALIGSYCQQGIASIPNLLTYRTIVLFVLILSSLLYNYYTSSIVGALLSSPIQGPDTFEEIVNSPMVLMFEDIGYNKVMIHDTKTDLIKQMVEKKVRSRSATDPVPIYISIEKSIPYLKRGGIALHADESEVFNDIAKNFDANEICDLRVVKGPLDAGIMNFNLPKRSQYTEAFKIETTWFQETGLVARLLRIYQPQQPACLSSATIHATTINGVITAFFALGCGMLLAMVILLGEITWARRRNRGKFNPIHWLMTQGMDRFRRQEIVERIE